MIVYHGSTEIIKSPDVVHSKKYLDFGRGFYITTFEKSGDQYQRLYHISADFRSRPLPFCNQYESEGDQPEMWLCQSILFQHQLQKENGDHTFRLS